MKSYFKFPLFLFLTICSNICFGQNSKPFDFITTGQKMEVISKNNVAKETLSFESPIDSLNNDRFLIRQYGKDGRELSDIQYKKGQISLKYTYQYSSLYSKVRVCSAIPNNPIENCYDLVWSEEENKLYKTLDNGFTPVTYVVMQPPFDLDKQRKPLIRHSFVKSYPDSLDSSPLDKKKIDSKLYFKHEFSYKEFRRDGKHILLSESKTWINRKRQKNKKKANILKIDFDPSTSMMSFYSSKGKKEWKLNKIQFYDSKGFFIGKEIFMEEHGYRISENLYAEQGDHYKMEVKRDENGLALEVREFVNDTLIFITNYDYEYHE